jgi:hypothetical protein
MKRNFNIDEILKSVDEIADDNMHKVIGHKKISTFNNPKAEKIISDAEKTLQKVTQTLLVLKEEFIENEILEEKILSENVVGVENSLKEMENKYAYENELLENKNIKQEEAIKDLNALLNNFKEKDMYSDLYNKIKLYQEDNAALRKKIFTLLETETNLRLQLSEMALNKQVDEKK